ncbi:chorismate mutase [Shouchella shacheensis]|uniref:chorismate mutase n=1 Tax=Shouchella shacheensis TaxID=1649580 RepID=UPI0007403A3E|nr:chorismate mutase [Shouchella shacheensis]
MVRGIRGATTVSANNAEKIIDSTEELVREMVKKNGIKPEEVAQVLVTTTADIDAAFPARALRKLNDWELVPVMCAREISVEGSLPLCIRVMMTVNTTKTQAEVEHIFLHEAKALRPDLAGR